MKKQEIIRRIIELQKLKTNAFYKVADENELQKLNIKDLLFVYNISLNINN